MKPKNTESHLELLLKRQLRMSGVRMPVREYRFAAETVGTGPGVRARLLMQGLKDWRFDFAWPDLKFAVEIEGVTPSGGRHQRIYGFLEDISKYHAGLDLGWTIYRTSGVLIVQGKALNLIEKIINSGVRRAD
jgi:hypothetical protein